MKIFKNGSGLQRWLISGLGLCLLLSQTACASREAAFQDSNQIESIDYFLRWQHSDFEAHYAWLNLLMPAAHAELPPQYQKAFSLHVEVQHSSQQIKLDYHSQQVIDDSTHQHIQQQLGAADYLLLMLALKQGVACENKVEPGWVGPAPALLRLQYPDYEDWLYANGSEGADGPGEKLSAQNTRRYLCNTDFSALLSRWIQDLKKSA